jgi:hypothetical protein
MLLLLFLEIPGYLYESTQNIDNNNNAKKSIILMIIKIINQVLMNKNVLWFYCSQHIEIIWLFNLLILSVPDEGYSRNASCALN